MKVLKATQEQYEELNGLKFGVSQIEFGKDADNNWIVNHNLIDDPAFLIIKESLLELEQIDYNPIIPEE